MPTLKAAPFLALLPSGLAGYVALHQRAKAARGMVTQPGEVEGDLLSEVVPDVVQRLVAVPATPARPVLEQNLSHTQPV